MTARSQGRPASVEQKLTLAWLPAHLTTLIGPFEPFWFPSMFSPHWMLFVCQAGSAGRTEKRYQRIWNSASLCDGTTCGMPQESVTANCMLAGASSRLLTVTAFGKSSTLVVGVRSSGATGRLVAWLYMDIAR